MLSNTTKALLIIINLVAPFNIADLIKIGSMLSFRLHMYTTYRRLVPEASFDPNAHVNMKHNDQKSWVSNYVFSLMSEAYSH